MAVSGDADAPNMRDGTVQPVKVEVHPDPLCQELLEQVREAEAVQTVDRVRPIFNRRRLILMNDLCLDVTYDRVLTHTELVVGGTRWEKAWRATGILPLGDADLHKAHPGLFRTEKAAQHALERDRDQIPPSLKYDSIWAVGVFAYRRAGQSGRSSRILVDTERHPNPRAAVETVLGPLVMFNAEPTPAASPTAAPEAERATTPDAHAVAPDSAVPLVDGCHPLSEPHALYPQGVVEAPVTGMITVRRPPDRPGLVLMELLDGCIVPFVLPVASADAPATRRHQIWHAGRPGAQPQPLRCEVLVA